MKEELPEKIKKGGEISTEHAQGGQSQEGEGSVFQDPEFLKLLQEAKLTLTLREGKDYSLLRTDQFIEKGHIRNHVGGGSFRGRKIGEIEPERVLEMAPGGAVVILKGLGKRLFDTWEREGKVPNISIDANKRVTISVDAKTGKK